MPLSLAYFKKSWIASSSLGSKLICIINNKHRCFTVYFNAAEEGRHKASREPWKEGSTNSLALGLT
jgi:hypothetical protein